jgi:hypothetical protein
MNISKINKGYNKYTFRLTERLTTAKDTYDTMLKLNTEQETMGEFNILLDNLREISKDKDFDIDIHPDMFTGREDVILELNITIGLGKTMDVKDVDNELVLGSILKEIRDHFGVYYSGKPDNVDSDIIKSYFRGY